MGLDINFLNLFESMLIITFYSIIRPPRSGVKNEVITVSDEENEEDPDCIEAKIVLRDVSTSGKHFQIFM